MEKLTPGDDGQYKRALEKKMARKMFEFKLGALIFGLMVGFVVIMKIIWFLQ